MKTPWMIAAVAVAVLAAGMPSISDAKRLGSGRSQGMQRDMPARTAPNAPPATPATPGQQSTAGSPAAAAAPGAAAAAGKRSWMGPIAGLAAGLGIAALMSHLGLGEAFGNFLMMALLAVAAVFLVRFLMRRFGNGGAARPATAFAGGNAMTRSNAQVAWPTPAGSGAGAAAATEPAVTAAESAAPASAAGASPASVPTRAFVPASFDADGFSRIAKSIFIRLQAANDAGDVEDLRRFTTPEMFAALRLDLLDRGAQDQHTDVQEVQADVLDVAEDGERPVVSVRFHGRVVETAGAPAERFDEVWHLVKPARDGDAWLIAGIKQQLSQTQTH